MYKCAITNKNSKLGEKCNITTILTRPKQYRHWDEENEKEWFTSGWEIVKEVKMSKEGLEIWNSKTPEEQFLLAKTLK